MALELAFDYTLFIQALVGVFVIVNPFGNVPIFISLTAKMDSVERRAAIVKSVVIAAAILLVFALIGQTLFSLLHVTLSSLRIAGGFLLLAIAFDMVMGKSPAARIDANEERDAIAVTPMATPLLAGPGAMSTVMILMNEAHVTAIREQMGGLQETELKLGIIVAILIAMAASFVVLINSERVYAFIRKDGSRVLTKIMGIVLGTIAIEMAVSGIHEAFPALASSVATAAGI
jgi:multiple antibiotic resistance protein